MAAVGSTGARSPFARARPLILARTAVAGITAVLPLVLAREFTQEDYGTYKQLFLISQTIFYVLQLGVPQSLFFFLPRVEERRPYLVQALLFLAATGALAAAALLLGAHQIGLWLRNPEFPSYAPALAVYLFGLMCSSPLEISLTARGQTKVASAFYLGSELVRAAAMTLPAVLGFGLHGVMTGIAGFAAARALMTWLMVPRGAAGPWVRYVRLREQLRYALPFGAAVALAIPQQYFHQYAVAAYVDPATFAIYAVGLFQLPVIDLLYNPTAEVLMVTIGELDREGRPQEGAEVFRGAVARLAYAFVPLVVFLVLAAPQLIVALFTSRYAAAVPIFRIGVSSAVFAMLPLDGVLRARGFTWHILASNVLKAVATVPLVLAGVSRFGMLGGICAWLACESLGKAALLAFLPRALGARMRDLFPWRELGRAWAAAVAAAVVMVGSLVVMPQLRPMFALVLCAGTFGLGYAAALYVVGARLPFELVGLRRLVAAPVAPRSAA